MPDNAKPVETLPVAVGPSEALGGLAKALRTLRDPGTWLRIGMFLTGMLLLLLGLLQVTGDNKMSDTTKTVIKLGTAVVTKKVK